MASITELKDRKKNPFRVQVKKKGYKTLVAYFPEKGLAEEWCKDREEERSRLDHGMELTKDHLRKKTVGTLVTEYMKRKTPKKATALTEIRILNNFLAFNNFKDRRLVAFKRQDAWDFVEYLENDYQWAGKPYMLNGKLITPTRQPRHIVPATIQRTLSVLKHIWKEAELKWRGYEELPNPWSGVKSSKPVKSRSRRLRPGELAQLIEACNGCKGAYRRYAPLAIYLAIETGMRLQEIFNLHWEDICLDRRRIHIRHTKTDYRRKTDGRWIVLTLMACSHLRGHKRTFGRKEGKVFPMSKDAFKQSWADIIERAGIARQHRDYKMRGCDTIIEKDNEGLTFHDLRREAASRFKRCLLIDEVGAMLGHGDKTVTEIYLQYDEDDLTEIQNKLDRYVLGGLTEKEATSNGMTYNIVKEDGDIKLKVMTVKEQANMFEMLSNKTTTTVVETAWGMAFFSGKKGE